MIGYLPIGAQYFLIRSVPDILPHSQVKGDFAKACGDNKVDAIFCVAGGWAGGNASNEDFVKNTDLMMKQSIWTSVISANVAAFHLKDGGLLTLTGAVPCLKVFSISSSDDHLVPCSVGRQFHEVPFPAWPCSALSHHPNTILSVFRVPVL